MKNNNTKQQIVKCNTCFYNCALTENQIGQCGARYNHCGKIISKHYGKLAAIGFDPIEKKPLKLFFPESMILSVGSYGCNMHCAFCQNAGISQTYEKDFTYSVTPEELTKKAFDLQKYGNIGVAYTYNEPLVSWEYVLDTAKLVKEKNMKNVIVTNCCVNKFVLDKVLPFTDAMNIDLKGFSKQWYSYLGGDLETVKNNIMLCQEKVHVELTTLIIPNKNDSEEEMQNIAKWISSINKNIPLHITRAFPNWKMTNFLPPSINKIYSLAEVAKKYLDNVFVGNC